MLEKHICSDCAKGPLFSQGFMNLEREVMLQHTAASHKKRCTCCIVRRAPFHVQHLGTV